MSSSAPTAFPPETECAICTTRQGEYRQLHLSEKIWPGRIVCSGCSYFIQRPWKVRSARWKGIGMDFDQDIPQEWRLIWRLEQTLTRAITLLERHGNLEKLA